jgi:CYTH domain-containing protein/predicted ATPase
MKRVKEDERRWLVTQIDPDVQRSPSIHIVQGWFDGPGNLRVRIVDDERAELTRKRGKGRSRIEENPDEDVPLGLARYLLDSTQYRLSKRRFLKDGWEIDFFEGPLAGLVLAEFEMESADQDVSLPPWIPKGIEVTDTLTNRHLARMAYDLANAASDKPVREYLEARVPRVVLTGGPCSGKSTVMDGLRRELRDVLQCVPEVATIIIDQVGAKPPVGDPIGMCAFQRTIYRVQCGFEKVSDRQARNDGKRALLLDRGTVDSAAYMERGHADLERVCMTTVEEEYGRYAGVVCLDVPPREVYDANKDNNPARYETYEQAAALGERIADAWSGHPRFVRIGNDGGWERKFAAARAAILEIIDASS